MPRQAFRADLKAAAEDCGISSITDVSQFGDDNEFAFHLFVPDLQESFRVTCLVLPDVGEYPSSHSYQLFADDNAPSAVASKLGSLQTGLGKTIHELLHVVSNSFGCEDDDVQMEDEDEEDFDMEDYYNDDDFGFNDTVTHERFAQINRPARAATVSVARMRSDLAATKQSGFKVGIDGSKVSGAKCHVCVSIRINKLGISEQAMQSWHIEPDDYLILVISYLGGYQSLESLLKDIKLSKSDISFKVGLSKTYKPTHDELVEMFRPVSHHNHHSDATAATNDAQTSTSGWRNTFISRPLNELLNERLLLMLQARVQGFSWAGAERYYHDIQGSNQPLDHGKVREKYKEMVDQPSMYPEIVTADHIGTSLSQTQLSAPLIAMQFLLRHFVRCTEFCLVCHRSLENKLQAIKPYVCDNPLCLYQYMSLGFGPSIEHDILTQPLVVDLLISFCWKSAQMGTLNSFPTGMSLSVPDPTLRAIHVSASVSESDQPEHVLLNAVHDIQKCEMKFENGDHRIKTGDWIMVRSAAAPKPTPFKNWRHHRVLDALGMTLKISATGVHSGIREDSLIEDKHSLEYETVEVIRYDHNFDDLDEPMKRQTLVDLMDLLPSVDDMKEFLSDPKVLNLAQWTEKMPQASYGVLRWIIASNRACIMQVESSERVTGLNDAWVQFRFAMGAPDKEMRFVNAVAETESRLHLQFPTLFAWHGSGINNWHSIIREGLHFKQTFHGRAYGHGVYFSPHFQTSLSYCQGYVPHNGAGIVTAGAVGWSKSTMGVNTAMSLNEIVNAPAEFVSRNPHFVVDKLDWIQTRYLFVQCVVKPEAVSSQPITNPVPQDPLVTPSGESGKSIVLPWSAVPRANRPSASKELAMIGVETRSLSGPFNNVKVAPEADIDIDDTLSIATLDEDLELFRLISDTEDDYVNGGDSAIDLRQSYVPTPEELETDFVPGALDHSTLPRLPPPEDASPMASKQLLQRFNALIKVQDSKAPAALGWYIDPQQFGNNPNFFQWIIELHSFDQTTLLAKDMKQVDITSIVLEFRFPKDFPYAPPFVRVVRPRLLPFNSGGGGHVTLGGSLCMQLLTNDGWLATMDIEGVLVSIRHEIMDPDPRPARLETHRHQQDYGIGEAVEGYIRACATHGWRVPVGFKESMMMMEQPPVAAGALW